MTTVENERDRVTTVRDTSVAEPPTGPMTAVPAGVRERFGGAKVGAAFFGWLVAIGMTVLLTGLVALAVAAWDRGAGTVPFLADTASAGLTGMGTAVAVLAIGYLTGGYVAGRLARFDGARNGLLTWLLGLILTVLAGVAAAIVGANTNFIAAFTAAVRLPAMPVDASTMTVSGAVLLAVTVLVTALAAAIGGRLGERFHRRVDRAAGLNLR
jgi:hypothetical protein